MENDTVKLLKECSSGTKMAINSLKQIQEHARDPKLNKAICTSLENHHDLENKAASLLAEQGRCEEEPGLAAVTFSWTMSEMKIMMKQTDSQLAKLVMDGCNMGIQGISKALNDYPDASHESVQLANAIIKEEENLMSCMKPFR